MTTLIKRPSPRNPWLSARACRLIRKVQGEPDDEQEITVEGRTAYVGNHRVNIHAVDDLLRLCLIRTTYDSGRDYTVYELCPEAAVTADDPKHVPAIVESQRTGKPVFR